ncbi:MAG TPA: DUF342 domain-containing protein [Desulfurivibrio alkaliphilus]|uniref:DUF342 domain-containing protein n=1 Tax=Desulfurivibrio alkaliphilus TaxID=427923 RepID=A0A7C2XA15_9BACT|nr:DUF342 domain-containing protein [Desulfurivibrio alkaliphilus]
MEWTRVHVDGSIQVRDQIMRSHVFACGTVDVTAGPGRIRGGVVSAIHGVEAIEVGSPAGVRTVVMVGANPALSIENCLLLMRVTGTRRLPVVEGEKLVGMISNFDVFNRLLGELG